VPGYALPAALDDESFNFFLRQLRGQPQQRARWKRCSSATDEALGEELGEVYVKTYFSPESKAKTVEMVKDIEDAMDNNIDTLTWMSPETN
jgi:predicted metalloendopeptidase